MHSFRGFMEQINFDSIYLLRTGTFLEDLSLGIQFFKGSLLIASM